MLEVVAAVVVVGAASGGVHAGCVFCRRCYCCCPRSYCCCRCIVTVVVVFAVEAVALPVAVVLVGCSDCYC